MLTFAISELCAGAKLSLKGDLGTSNFTYLQIEKKCAARLDV